MRIGIVGAGGTGGYFGARLAAAGNSVTFVARGAQGAALREKGLRLESHFGNLHLPEVAVVERPEELPGVDVVLNCVKLWDLEESGRALAGGSGLVVPVQNGVEAAAILRRHLPAERVAAGIAYISATIAEPGTIRQSGGFAGLAFGALQPQQRSLLEQLTAACKVAGIEARLSDNIERDLWMKFLMLQALAGATATRGQNVGELRADAEGRALLQGLVEETVALGRAEGVDLPADVAAKTWQTIEGLPAGVRASMALDLERGNKLELPWLNGYVARRSAERGLAAPRSQAVVDQLGPRAAGGQR